MDPRLRAQIEYLRSDARLRERGLRAAELTPAERLEQGAALARAAAAFASRLPPDQLERLESLNQPPSDAAPVLRRLAGRNA